MLVLTRRVGETIVIDGNIQVTVVAVRGDRIRLGITAPEHVAVDRSEIHQRRGEFTAPPPPADQAIRRMATTSRSSANGGANVISGSST